MEICSAAGAEFVKESGKAALRQVVRYCFYFKNLVEELGEEKNKLNLKQQTVDDGVRKARENTEKISNEVQKWLKDARSLIQEADSLEEKARQGCCLEGCPNWISRFHLGKQIAKLTSRITSHIAEHSSFRQFGRCETLVGISYHQPQDFQYFNSTKLAYKQLFEALQDEEIHMIGLWGMAGSGKTTLVKQVGLAAQTHEPKLFDKVIFVVVSSNVDVRKIQAQIADELGLQKKEDDESGRAQRLSMRLKQGEKVVIILDDLWQVVPLKEIGIPFGEDCSCCKVILTTTKREVCTLMNCQGTVRLGLLKEEEAWKLFQMHAGVSNDTADTWKSDLGKKISEECGRLPVAIVALSRSLKDKPKVMWHDALTTLKSSELVDIPESLRQNENPYKCLKLSYDNLEDDEKARSLFLLCSLFPEDSVINYEDLFRHAFGLAPFENVKSCERMKIKVRAATDKLIDSCLLIQAEEGRSVTMHDWVRDVALSIAKNQIQLIMCPEMDLQAWLEDEAIKDAVTKLYCHEINEFPDQLDCPNLEILYVHRWLYHSCEVPDAFFTRVKGLKVLTIKSISLGGESLHVPRSIQELTNLRTLCLRGCNMEDVYFLGKLNKLILLDVSDCEIRGNPFEVLGSCSRLEELYFLNNDLLEESICSQNLAKCFHRGSSSSVLQRYHLQIGSSNEIDDDLRMRSPSRLLWIACFDAFSANATIRDLVGRAEFLVLESMEEGCKNIIPDVVHELGSGVNELNEFWLLDSEWIECLMDNTKHSDHVGIAFPNLGKLRIEAMERMRAICLGPPPHGLFDKLEVLEIKSCSKLTFLFTPAVVRSLVLLGELQISRCEGLKYLIANVEEEGQITSDDDGLVFPKLKLLHVDRCQQLEYLIPVSYAGGLQQLEHLEISKADNLRYIFGQSNQNQNEFHIINLPVFKRLHLQELPNIHSIYPKNYCLAWPLLEKVNLIDCPIPKTILAWLQNIIPVGISIGDSVLLRQQCTLTITEHLREAMVTFVQNLRSLRITNSNIEGIFSLHDQPPINGQVNSRLTHLSLYNLPELRCIWMGANQVLSLQHLKEIWIKSCEKLKAIFPAYILRSLPQLMKLLIENCKNLEQMIENNLENQNMSESHPHQLRYILMGAKHFLDLQNLNVLMIEGCGKLDAIFSVSVLGSLQRLDELWIENCKNLEHIIEEDVRPNPHARRVCFPQLTTLVVRGCHNLKRVFSISTSQVLPKLRDLLIVEASQLGQVFGHQAVLPQLENLLLVQLESLTHVCQGIELQTVRNRFVYSCPKLSLTSTATLADMWQIVERDGNYSLEKLLNGLNIITEFDFKTKETTREFALPAAAPYQVHNISEDKQSKNEAPTNEDSGITERSPSEETKEDEESEVDATLERKTPSQELIDQLLLGQAILLDQQQCIEAIAKERVREDPALKDVIIAALNLSADVVARNSQGPLITPPQEEFSLELLKEETKYETIMTRQHAVADITPDKPSNPSTTKNGSLFKASTSKESKRFHSIEMSPSISFSSVYSQFPSSTLEAREFLASSSSLSKANTSSNITRIDFEDLVDFHGLFKMDARRASLLNKAFAKYPHLWEWRKCIRSTKYCKMGYECLADMLLFLKLKSPKNMDESSQEEFEKLYADVEPFGFDSEWMASIYQKIMDAKVHNENLKELHEMEYLERNLVEVLNTMRGKKERIRDNLSKHDTEFDFLK